MVFVETLNGAEIFDECPIDDERRDSDESKWRSKRKQKILKVESADKAGSLKDDSNSMTIPEQSIFQIFGVDGLDGFEAGVRNSRNDIFVHDVVGVESIRIRIDDLNEDEISTDD